jgi:hypothetical protein
MQKEYKTTEGYTATILEYNGWYNVKIQLNDGTILENIIMSSLKVGNVKNPNHKTTLNVGYFGIGKYNSKDNSQAYIIWRAMFQRCYDKKYQEKQPTYKGCSVAEEWHNFQNFAKWYEENYNPETMHKWQLDKDTLFKGNKVYSKETCCFLPRDINNSLQKRKGKYLPGVKKKINRFQAVVTTEKGRINAGSYYTELEAFEVYKTEKEKYVRFLADKYKSILNNKAYEALYNYQVEITD